MQRFRRAKRDEFLIHSADVMRSHSLRNLGRLTNVMFTEPRPKTIICSWRMGNLLCTGTRSLRLAINNKPATAQLPKNSSAMRSLVCPERDERMEILSDHLYRWWVPWAHITEGKSLFFSQAPMCVCALTVLSLYDVPVHTPVSVDCSSSLTVIKERWQRIRLKRRHRGRSAPSSPLNLRWRMQEGIDFFLSIHCRHTMFDMQRKYSMSHTHYSTFCVAKHFFHRFSHRNTFNSVYILILFTTRALFSSVTKSIYFRNEFFFSVIFIPNEILGQKKIILTKNTYTRIQKVCLSLGVVKWKEFNINCEQMNMIDSIITDVGDPPVFFNNR